MPLLNRKAVFINSAREYYNPHENDTQRGTQRSRFLVSVQDQAKLKESEEASKEDRLQVAMIGLKLR